MPKTVKLFEGSRSLPVTDGFYAQNYARFPDLESLTRQEIEDQRIALLKLSDVRFYGGISPVLTDDERARLEALTNVKNVHNAIAWLGNTPHTEFGFEGADQVHGNHHHLPCGCMLRSVHDHNLRHDPERLKVHPHKPIHTCPDHPLAAHGGDHKEHFKKVAADNATKE